MFGMTVAVNVPPRSPSHPQGGAGAADAHTTLCLPGSLTPPASPAPHHATAIVILNAASTFTHRTFTRHEQLFSPGEAAEHAYYIEEGMAALTLEAVADRQRVLALAGPGDVIGALSPNLQQHTHGAAALSGQVAVRLLPAGDPALAELLAAAAGQHIARLTWALEDAAHPVPSRLARALLRLGQRFGQYTDSGAVRLTLPITHDTLAALVGAARETTTTIIQQLRHEGLLEGTRGSYRFQPQQLAEYAHRAALAAR